MDFLLISNIVLWIGFVAMILVNLALARQIGVLYERIAPAGALMVNQQLEVGATAPELALQTLDGSIEQIGKPEPGQSQLVFFVAPDCPVCSTLIPVLKSAARAEGDWLHIVIASDGSEYDHQAFVASKDIAEFPYIVSELLGKTYGVSKLPYGILIDEKGTIASMGIINSREHLESLFEAKERKVASIQEYMDKRSFGKD